MDWINVVHRTEPTAGSSEDGNKPLGALKERGLLN
jgi:hypothetical protein